MNSDAAQLLAERGLGPVDRSLRLSGALLGSAGGGQPELCLVRTGAWLVVPGVAPSEGRVIDAADPETVQYERGRLRDRLIVDGGAVTIPAGNAERARVLLALGRLRRMGYRATTEATPPDSFVSALDDGAQELARGLTGPEDTLLVFTPIGAPESFVSQFGATVDRSFYLFLSAERCGVAWVSELGDSGFEEGSPSTLRLERQGDSARFVWGDHARPLSRAQAELVAELIALHPLQPAERLYEAARLLWLRRAGRRPGSPTRLRELLSRAAERDHGRAALALTLLVAHLDGPAAARDCVPRAVQVLAAAAAPAEAAAQVYTGWQFPAEAARIVLTLLVALGDRAEPWALTLHRALHAAHGSSDDAGADLELASHELAAGDARRARSVVEHRLRRSPADEEAVLAPERAGVSHRVRVALLELLCREAERRGAADEEALAELARLEPANMARHRELAVRGDRRSRWSAAARAAHVIACLAPGGLHQPVDGASDTPRPLSETELSQELRHPLARGGRVATWISELLASTPEPDLGFLRDFCEELSPGRHPDAMRALARATRILGLSSIRAYVSRGARSVGMRAFSGREAFILVGQEHLDDDAGLRLRGAELDFAFGAELSHLALGHERVTATEVWAGAAGKTRDALMALGVVLPVISELAGPRAQRLLTKLSPDTLSHVLMGALKLDERFGRSKGPEPNLGKRNEELIVAHRVVQLSADRAGLITCGALAPALRAMLLLRSDYRGVLEASQSLGFFEALESAAPPGLEDLRARARALISFYVSSEFRLLADR